MDSFVEFISFKDTSTLVITIGVMVVCVSSSLVGTFIYLRKQALVGDAISHALLPGVCIGFLLAGEKNIYALVVGATLSGWVSIFGIHFISQKTKIKEDAAIGLVLSFFFGLGIMLLTYIQHSGNQNQSGLNHYLFGQAASLVRQDIYIFIVVSMMIFITFILFYKEIKVVCFDPEFARVCNLPVRLIYFLLNALIVFAIVTGVQAVGMVLMAALLITPAAGASFWTSKLDRVLLIGAFIAAISSFFGAYISYVAPAMPTGPWIVVVISFAATISFLFAPEKGILAIYNTRKNYLIKNAEENVLKCLYTLHLHYQKKSFSAQDILNIRFFDKKELRKILCRLLVKGYLNKKPNNNFEINQYGFAIGEQVMKKHLLWEIYLADFLDIAPDHLHEDAESIEHLLTPALVVELEKKLEDTKLDIKKELEKDYKQQL